MLFMPNNSPFAGREGKWVTSRNLRERLAREVLSNVSLRVEETEAPDVFKVSGRGVLHLSILIETMRREGYELQVSRPEVITKTENGLLTEPIEEVVVEVPEEASGVVIDKLNQRRGRMVNLTKEPAVSREAGTDGTSGGRVRLFYEIPARGLIGFRTEFLTDTRGEGVLYSNFKTYEPWKGDIPHRTYGVLIADRQGDTVTYGLHGLQDRGALFIGAGVPVYPGQVIGIHMKGSDLNVNPTKTKKLTNMRASGSDDALRLTPPREMGLEPAIEFVAEDELVEVTPQSVRLRKKLLTENERKRGRA
jgi:GTP-binding protein